MAARAASPTCCPVPSGSELVRPCYCHRTQMSAGQPWPAPRFARACSSRSLRGAGAAVWRSTLWLRGAFAWVSECLLASGSLSDVAVSPRSRPSARCPIGPQNTLHRNYSRPPLCMGSHQTVSISSHLLTYSLTALWFQTQKGFFSS